MTRRRASVRSTAAALGIAAVAGCSAPNAPEAAFSASAVLSAADPDAEFAVPASVRSGPPDLVVVRSRIVRDHGPFTLEATLVDAAGAERLLGRAATFPAAAGGDFAFAWPRFPASAPLREGAAVRIRFEPAATASPDLAVAVSVRWRRN